MSPAVLGPAGPALACRSMATDDDATLVQRLRAGEEAAFVDLVGRYQAPLLRLAETTVGSRAVAQEVTQDTWLAVLRGVDRFEGRSSFKTWLFHILLNRARSAGRGSSGPGVPTRRSTSASTRAARGPSPRSRGPTGRTIGWTPPCWPVKVKALLPQLPDAQRQVVLLRDVEGLAAADVCRAPRGDRRQPAGAAPPGPGPAARPPRRRGDAGEPPLPAPARPRLPRGGRARHRLPRGPARLPRRAHGSRPTSPPARTARSTSRRCR